MRAINAVMFDPSKDISLAVIEEKLRIQDEFTPNLPRKSISDLNRFDTENDKDNDIDNPEEESDFARLVMGAEEEVNAEIKSYL